MKFTYPTIPYNAIHDIPRYRRVLVPTQDQLQSLDLYDGENEVSFELENKTGTAKGVYKPPALRTQLFVWPQDAKIVIIDIEGAITAVSKSGVGWGGFLSAPRTAVHNGVAKLLTNISRNGYRILYIAQSTNTALGTKEHLAKVAAGSDIKLPPGPVFQSPDSLIRYNSNRNTKHPLVPYQLFSSFFLFLLFNYYSL